LHRIIFKGDYILLIGIDIIDIERVKKTAARTPRFLYRIFTKKELEYCMGKKNPYPSLAVRFAAKEAVRKLDPVFISGVRFHDIEVLIKDNGQPYIVLHRAALAKSKERGLNGLSLSLSHADNQAIAAVIASKE
jgi:holo-[acyl-carrier protein] synthase